MKNKSSALYLFITISIFSLLLSSCGPKTEENGIISSQKPSSSEAVKTSEPAETAKVSNADRDPNYITPIEAAELGYAEVVKSYSDTVLWSITNGSSLATHYDWKNTGLSYNWTVSFVSPSENKLIHIYINGGEINNTVVDNKSNIELKSDLPKDRPLMTLVEAIKEVDANGGITGLRPTNIEYGVSGYYDNDFPYWGFLYNVPLGDGSQEKHLYYVNAVSGKFAEAKYKNTDNDEIEKNELVMKDKDLSNLAWQQDQRYTVIKFLTLINENSTDKAVEMMDDYAVPNNSSKEMWIESLSSIRGMKFLQGGFLLSDDENWTDDTQRFKVKIDNPEGNDSQRFGWDSGENQRFFTLVKQGGEWKIHEISTGF